MDNYVDNYVDNFFAYLNRPSESMFSSGSISINALNLTIPEQAKVIHHLSTTYPPLIHILLLLVQVRPFYVSACHVKVFVLN